MVDLLLLAAGNFMEPSSIGRGLRFFMVAGLMAWGGAQLEATLHRYINRLGWATVVLVAIGSVLYQWSGVS